MNEIGKLAEKKKTWKAKDKEGKMKSIPLDELEDDHLRKAFTVAQNIELDYYSRMIRVSEEYDKIVETRKDLFEEARRRKIASSLKFSKEDYFTNEFNAIMDTHLPEIK